MYNLFSTQKAGNRWLTARCTSWPRLLSWACSSQSIYRLFSLRRLQHYLFCACFLINRTCLYGWCHGLSFVEFIFTRKLFFSKLYCCYRTILLYTMNMHYSHGLIKAIARQKYRQGDQTEDTGRKEGGVEKRQKARWMCHTNKGTTTWQCKEYGLI